jgi:hypothetical protein
MLPQTIENSVDLPNISVEDIPEWQRPMYTNFVESTEILISYIKKGLEADLSSKQIESVFRDEGRSWWENSLEIIPENVVCLVHEDMRVQRPNIDEDIPVSERTTLSLSDLENWVNVNREVFEGMGI